MKHKKKSVLPRIHSLEAPQAGSLTKAQMAYYVYVANLSMQSNENLKLLESKYKTLGIYIWDVFNFEEWKRFHTATVELERLTRCIKEYFGDPTNELGLNEKKLYLRDWRRARSIFSMLLRRIKSTEKPLFHSKAGVEIFTRVLKRFLREISDCYPITTDENKAAKGLISVIEAKYRINIQGKVLKEKRPLNNTSVKNKFIRSPNSMDYEINSGIAIFLAKNVPQETIIDLIDETVKILVPPFLKPLPFRYRQTIKRRIQRLQYTKDL